jgi:hypothetical protein
LAEFGLEAIFSAVIKRMEKDGKSKEDIFRQISKLPISSDLKRRLRDLLFGDGGQEPSVG